MCPGKAASSAQCGALHLNNGAVCFSTVYMCVCHGDTTLPEMKDNNRTGLENVPSILQVSPFFFPPHPPPLSPHYLYSRFFKMTLQSDDAPAHYTV